MWRELTLGLAAPIAEARLQQPVGWRGQQPVRWSDWLAEAQAWRLALERQPHPASALYFEDALSAAAALFAAWHAGRTVWWPGDALPATARRLQELGIPLVGDWPQALAPLRLDEAASAEPALDHAVWSPLDPEAEALVVFTSGTTGEPVALPKHLHQLFDEVRALEAAFGMRLQGVDRVVATVSHQHIYGLLFRVLWPLAAGRPLVAQRVAYLEDLGAGTARLAVVASPAHLKRLEASQLQPLAPRLAALFSSGGPLPAQALAPCFSQLGQTPIEVYGSSETGGVAWRQRAPGAGEDAAWRPLPGVTWELRDERLYLRSPHLPTPDWWPTQDRARAAWDGFELLGRADRIVKIEEKRVSLTAVEQALRGCGEVADVRLVVLPGLRHELGVVLVPDVAGWASIERGGRAAWLAQRRAALAEVLEPTVRPRRYRLMAELPVNAQGKTPQAVLQALFDPLRPAVRSMTRPDEGVRFVLDVEARHPGFEGHFPGHPVLPGVVQLDWVERLAREVFADLPPHVNGLEQLKFQQVIRPDSCVELRLQWDASKRQLRFAFSSEVGAHASGRLCFSGATA
ncbi:AMP-binding protein [Inhella gelatinilytica]|uniref:AMP-binding protein n=1 Tax=Inhella gelatinilytica TaxID=2795030 RepID=UPI001FE56742|nr:AMP-binding protein [Inhella gelatinilytica]